MEDFFALMFEELMNKIIGPIDSINNVSLRIITQIIILIVSSLVFIGVAFFVSFIVKTMKNQWGIVLNNPIYKAMLLIFGILMCFAIFIGIISFIVFLVKLFIS